MNAPIHELGNKPIEVHAFVNGVFVGFTAYPAVNDGDAEAEPHYWQAGFLLGRCVCLLAILLLVR